MACGTAVAHGSENVRNAPRTPSASVRVAQRIRSALRITPSVTDSPQDSTHSSRCASPEVPIQTPATRARKKAWDRFSLSFDSLTAAGHSHGAVSGAHAEANSSPTVEPRPSRFSLLGRRSNTAKMQKALQQAEDDLAMELKEQETIMEQLLLQKNHQIMKLKDAYQREQQRAGQLEQKLRTANTEMADLKARVADVAEVLRATQEKATMVERELYDQRQSNLRVYAWCIELNQENARLKRDGDLGDKPELTLGACAPSALH